jgi:hypothetical protein
MFRQLNLKKDELYPVTEKLTRLLMAIGESKIDVEPHQLPEFRELQSGLALCSTLLKDKEVYQPRLEETIGVLPKMKAYFEKKTGAMGVITALKALQEAMETLNTSLKAKTGGERPKSR